jgi:hypothetical protein
MNTAKAFTPNVNGGNYLKLVINLPANNLQYVVENGVLKLGSESDESIAAMTEVAFDTYVDGAVGNSTTESPIGPREKALLLAFIQEKAEDFDGPAV